MKNDIVSFIGGGIKCDNPECDYMDETVRVEDYKKWLNKPCPKCGSNLLTQADYDNVQMLIGLADIINENYVVDEETQSKLGDKQQTITFHMDGSGKMDVEINDAN